MMSRHEVARNIIEVSQNIFAFFVDNRGNTVDQCKIIQVFLRNSSTSSLIFIALPLEALEAIPDFWAFSINNKQFIIGNDIKLDRNDQVCGYYILFYQVQYLTYNHYSVQTKDGDDEIGKEDERNRIAADFEIGCSLGTETSTPQATRG